MRTLPLHLVPIEIRFESHNNHPPASSSVTVLRPGDSQFGAAVEALHRAGFPRPPSTFQNGREYFIPGETDAKLTVRTSAGERAIACFVSAWDEDPGYLRFLESLHPSQPRPPSWKLTIPASAEELELKYRWGSKHTSGHHWLSIIRSRKISYFIEHERHGKRVAPAAVLDDAEASALLAAVGAIDWRERPPPFDATAAAGGHTPASIQLRPGRDDESYAGHVLAWEQRHAAPEWSRLFMVLDAMVARLTPALR